MHTLFYLVFVVLGDRALVSLVQVAVIAVGDGMLDEDVAAAEHVPGRLAEQEAEGTDVDSHSAGSGRVHEFHGAAVIDSELQALGNIVNFG